MSIVAISCGDEDEVIEVPLSPQTYDVQGKVEKGPFISGSEISIQPMNSNLQVLGSMYNTSITDDLGNFILGNKEFPTPYAEFMATGYFFNEIKGGLSNGTLTLRALVDLSDNKTVNVNVLTHLKYARIKNLVASGMQFEEANKQAQKELLDAFGLGTYSNKEVSSFSIIAGTDESAALIAISSLLLLDRTEASLTEYLSKLSSDFGVNGRFSENIQNQLASDKKILAKYLTDVKANIIKRYEELGISVNIKDVFRYVDWDNDGLAGNELLKENENIYLEKTTIEVPNEGGSYTIKVESPITLYLTPQIETDTNIYPDNNVTTEEVFSDGLYEGYDDAMLSDKDIEYTTTLEDNTLVISVLALQSRNDKSITIPLYDYLGNHVASVILTQKGEELIIPSEIPLLGETAKKVVASIAIQMAEGLRDYNLIEQYYNYNKETNAVNKYVNSQNDKIYSSWAGIYKANQYLSLLKKADETRLNIYADYCNVLSALYYSNLVYGWDEVPYVTDYEKIEQSMSRRPVKEIFYVLKGNLLRAIDGLSEKKNESIKDANGFFFASKDVARVLLANIYMYEGDYVEALPLLQEVIDNDFYSLDASTNYKPSATTDNIDVYESTEVIFALLNDSGTRADVSIVEPGVIPYITLSDVYLSLAECHYMLEDSNTAERLIHSVIDAKNLSVPDNNVLMQIKEVREQILLYSGTYFAFLKRTNLAKDICSIEDYQLLFPIPYQELVMYPQMTQNPGY